MNKIIVNGHYVEPIGVQQIIKGIISDAKNPITHETFKVGNGEVLWDIGQTRDSPTFLLVRRTKALNSNKGGMK